MQARPTGEPMTIQLRQKRQQFHEPINEQPKEVRQKIPQPLPTALFLLDCLSSVFGFRHVATVLGAA